MKLKKRSQSASNYLLINGWILLLILLTVVALYTFGIFDFFKYASEKCELGDGLHCQDFIAEINEATGESDGDTEDKVIFEIENKLDTEIYNLSINVPDCKPIYPQKENISPGGEKTYIITHCKSLKPKGKLKTEIKIRYNTKLNSETVNHLSNGYIFTHVISPAPVRYHEKAGRSIADWIEQNIG